MVLEVLKYNGILPLCPQVQF
uniref:Uncharacterized protein n=1 Tax=Rhizophora mucronata TaxID=61149 RepID=A0A2P2Q0I9_RHIMU